MFIQGNSRSAPRETIIAQSELRKASNYKIIKTTLAAGLSWSGSGHSCLCQSDQTKLNQDGGGTYRACVDYL